MNKKRLVVLYLILLIVAAFALLRNQGSTLDLFALFQFEGNLLVVMVFNMLGVLPLLYFLFLLTYPKQKWYVYVLFSLSFLVGGYALILGLYFLNTENKVLQSFHKKAFIVLSSLILLMTLVGILFGDIRHYYELFLNDSFVFVMTFDWIIVVLIPFVSMKHISIKNYTTWFLS
jgi:hypothetical protein